MEVPETRFTRVGDDRVAYQVFGEGPPDLVYMAGTSETIDVRWEWPPYAHLLRRMGSFCRVVMFDRRGQGGSDRVSRQGVSVWEDWADDLRAVLDAVGSERAALFAGMEATPIATLFAATEPERTQALVLFGGSARFAADDDYPGSPSVESLAEHTAHMEETWGTEAFAFIATPDHADDPAYRRWFAKAQRAAASPRDATAFGQVIGSMDIRQILPSVHAPALVMHRKTSPWVPIEQSRYLADHLPEGRLLISDGHATTWSEPVEETLEAVEAFVTGARNRAPRSDRVLATVLFTDIVASTERAAAQGDRRWRSLLESHDTITRGVINQHGGRVVRTTGDGALATFDGPGRAVQCALSLRDALRTLAIEIRAGIHTGEIELLGDEIGGLGVHVAARVVSHADAGQIWVSSVVPLLMAGSNVEFEPRGDWALKGVPGEWALFSVRN